MRLIKLTEIHLIKLTCQATWSVANTPIVVFINVLFSSIVFSCSVLCKFCVFFLFLSKGSSKCGFFHLAVLFRFYHLLFALHHVFLSKQIKMMMMMMMITLLSQPVMTR